jgi:DNA polymerase III subunit beta
MKFSSLQENLKSGLITVSHIAGKNVNLPILNNIMIEAKENQIKFVTTDLEIGIICTIRGKTEEDGVFTVDSKIISDYISLLPNQKVDLECVDEVLHIKSGNYKTSINGQKADDFPLIPQIEKEIGFNAKLNEFKKALSQVLFSVSNSETRIELTGVNFNFSNDKLIMAATDSYRLAETIVDVKMGGNEIGSVIVPAKTLQELARILTNAKNENIEEDGGNVKFYISENQILFMVGSTELVSRLIEGQYPDYKQIIPVNSRTAALVLREELVRAVKAASIFSKSGVNDVNLDFPAGSNKVVVTSTANQAGENITELEANVEGDDNGIVVNFRFLLDALNSVESEKVKIEITDGNTPCLIKPEKESGQLNIIMPIKQ